MASRPEAAYAAAEVTPKWVLISGHHLLSPSNMIAVAAAGPQHVRPTATLGGRMYTHLLVPVDGSAAAEAALPHVRALAERFGARVTIVRVTAAPETLIMETSMGAPGAPDAGPAIDPTPVVEAEHEEAAEYLEHLRDRLQAGGPQVAI